MPSGAALVLKETEWSADVWVGLVSRDRILGFREAPGFWWRKLVGLHDVPVFVHLVWWWRLQVIVWIIEVLGR